MKQRKNEEVFLLYPDWQKLPKVRLICSRCGLLRIVKPLYKTTREERNAMKNGYVCSDCTELPPQQDTG